MIVLLSYIIYTPSLFKMKLKTILFTVFYMACESKHQFKEFKKLPYFEASFIDDKRSKVIKIL